MDYYKEDIQKDTNYRKEYAESINSFIDNHRIVEHQKRDEYISPEKFSLNPEQYRKDYVEMLGFPLTQPRKEVKLISKELVVEEKDIRIYRLQFLIGDTIRSYGIYFEQKDPLKKNFSFVLHGGCGTPELVSSIHMDSANYNHLARRIIDKGYNVFCPQLLLWNQDIYGNPYNRSLVEAKLRSMGGTITALEMWIMSSVLDYFVANEDIRTDNLSIAGLSYGGMYTLFMAAYDTRFKTAFSCSYVSDDECMNIDDWYHRDMTSRIGPAEIGALVSPRALFVSMGDHDELFDSKRTEKTCEKIKEYYHAMKAENNFDYHIFKGVHETDKEDGWLNFYTRNTK